MSGPEQHTRRPDPARSDPQGHGERGVRGLVGAGPTQVDITHAMRARDASRPTADDLAAAEEELVVVRRRWQARD